MKRKGPAFLLKFSNGAEPPAFYTVAGLRTTRLALSENKASITASGIFLGHTAEENARIAALDGLPRDMHLSFESGEKYFGRFTIKQLDYSGDYGGERNYSLNLEGTEVSRA